MNATLTVLRVVRPVFVAALLFAGPCLRAASDDSLDYLAGEWDIFDAAGKQIGTSVVAVQEKNAALYEIRTFNEGVPQKLWFFNTEFEGGWKQAFMSGRSHLMREFRTEEKMPDGRLRMGARYQTANGDVTTFRIFLSGPDATGATRRVLESSKDEGQTWIPVFDYTYRRKSK